MPNIHKGFNDFVTVFAGSSVVTSLRIWHSLKEKNRGREQVSLKNVLLFFTMITVFEGISSQLMLFRLIGFISTYKLSLAHEDNSSLTFVKSGSSSSTRSHSEKSSFSK